MPRLHTVNVHDGHSQKLITIALANCSKMKLSTSNTYKLMILQQKPQAFILHALTPLRSYARGGIFDAGRDIV